MKPEPKGNALAVQKQSAINLMAARMSVDPAKLFDTLKATCFKNATNEEMLALVVVSNAYDLNPLLKEIYAFPAKGGGIVPIVSVDGWNKMLINHPNFDGIEFTFDDDNEGNPYSCTATIYAKNRSKPVIVTEYFSECKRDTDPWRNMPRRMLRNRTLCQASRMAFGFSGVHNDDEAETINVEAVLVPGNPAPPKVVTLPGGEKTPQQELEAVVVTAGFTFAQVQVWGEATGNIEGANGMKDFSEIPSEVCKRILRAKDGLLKVLGDESK